MRQGDHGILINTIINMVEDYLCRRLTDEQRKAIYDHAQQLATQFEDKDAPD